MSKKNIVILTSGKGSLIRTFINNKPENINIELIISNTTKSKNILEYAKKNNIHTVLLNKNNISDEIWEIITEKRNIDGVLLLGFLKLLKIPEIWENKVINLHPSLLPKYGGKGMYGENVFKEVLKHKEILTGSTFHYCNNKYDKGKIIYQTEVPIIEGEGIEILMDTVIETQHLTLPNIMKLWANNELNTINKDYFDYPKIKFCTKEEIKNIEKELENINKFNIYYTYEWLKLCSIKEKCQFKFIFIELIRGEKCIFPYLKCKIDNLNIDNIYDAQSSYGYSGPLFWGNWTIEKKKEALEMINHFMKKDNIVYNFIRLSSHNTNDLSLYENFKLINVRKNFYVDCLNKNLNIELLNQGWSKKAKRCLKIAVKKGTNLYRETNNLKDIIEFSKIYKDTFERNEMEEYYNYDYNYIKTVLEIKNTKLLLINNYKEIISGCTIILNDDHAIYHLGASYSNKMSLGGSDFYYYSMVHFCKKNNIRWLQIGGGKQDNDSLYNKKKIYADKEEKIYVAGRVVNNDIFNKISEQWESNNPNKKKTKLMFYRY